MIYNFAAGPACLPAEVLSEIREGIPHWQEGISVMEWGHRSAPIIAMMEETRENLRKLLSVPEEFTILFMQGGARAQFSAIPMNLLQGARCPDYVITGMWSAFAFEEAKKYCTPHCVTDGQANNYTQIPDEKSWQLTPDAPYLHYTDNETVHGLEFPFIPSTRAWLVCDMTSNLLTRPIDFSRYGAIYAGAQKNLGISGITVVLVRKSLLGKALTATPSVLDYTVFDESQSLYNTAPVFAWYVLGLILKWCLSQGGISSLSKACSEKSQLIYDVIDNSDFYTNAVLPMYRSRLNVPFQLPSAAVEAEFIKQANAQDLRQLKGHKALGGCRASIYNAMPLQGVQALAQFMRTFEQQHG